LLRSFIRRYREDFARWIVGLYELQVQSSLPKKVPVIPGH
jgi:hypothetical protein